MPRIARNSFSNHFFHIITQGINKECIFNSKHNKEKYLHFLLTKLYQSNVKLLAYCIMDNHVHHLMYTENISEISSLMKSVNTSYAIYYNKTLDRVGYVFRNRFLSEPILDQKHLFSCLTYIHNNPVKAGIVKNIDSYIYSSYSNYIFKNGIVNDNTLNLLFGSSKNYLNTFLELHKHSNFDFLDCSSSPILAQTIIDDFIKKMNLPLLEIKHNPFFLKQLIFELHTQGKLSERSISNILEISRYLIHKILNS